MKVTSQNLIDYGITNMRKTLLLAVALLVPGLAYGGNPSANLSVQVVPAGKGTCGTIMGQAATDAAAAGFNTCALYNDFTTPIPNTVGTGLPSNWLDCNLDASTSAVWYWGFSLFQNSSEVHPCAGHVDWNVVDPVYGNDALRFTMNYSEMSATDANANAFGMQSVNYAGQTNPFPGPGQYPYSYYEWTFRTDTPNPGGGGEIYNAFWSWISPPAKTLATQSSYVVELDFTETGAWSNGDFAAHRWGPNGQNNYWLFNTNAGLPTTSYHTWGMLFTGDGGSNFSTCVYVDGVRQACNRAVYDASGENLQRRYLMAHFACGDSSGFCTSNFGTSHHYVKSFKVLTCANWQQSSAAGMCNGSTLNGSGFYQ
jgi:hypothetical protein